MARENVAKSLEVGINNEAIPLTPELAVMMKEEVDRTKGQKLPVNRAFEVIAKKSGLKFNTVRNYYYRYIHEKDSKSMHKSYSKLSVNKTRRDQGVAGNSFKEAEVKNLIITMLQAQAQGESVRSCANRLANNEPKLMLRYQNKYRNIIANKQEYVKALMKDMDNKGINYYDPFKKICVNDINAQDGRKNDLLNRDRDTENNLTDSASSREELLEVIGELTANMREIDGKSFEFFFKGLRDLSKMAIQWKKREEWLDITGDSVKDLEDSLNKYREMLKEKDLQIQGLYAKILSYEAQLEDQRKRIARFMSMFHQLMSVNRNFLNLSSAGKISGLQDYTRELESLVKGYDTEVGD